VKKRINGKSFFDTNVIIYAFREDDKRNETARMLLARGGLTGVQALNEFIAVTRRKLGMSWTDITRALATICILCPSPVPLTLEIHEKALQIAERYGYHIYDSLLIAAALKASCTTLYSEDMHDGQVIDGLTIRNPFPRIN
jgi:predicted nucleic acid-binding protein